jgi:hypothetical protein
MRFAPLLCCLLAFAPVARADDASAKFIDGEINRLVELYSDGIAMAYPEYRHVKFGKLLEQGGEAAVALFSVEGFQGGNLHEEYLAVFEPVEAAEVEGKRTNPYRLLAVQKIGGRGWRTFDWETMQIARGSVVLKGKQWKAADPGCCASAAITATFRLRDDALVEARK